MCLFPDNRSQFLQVSAFRLLPFEAEFCKLPEIFSALLYAKQRIVLPNVAALMLNATILLTALLLQPRFGIFALAYGLLLGALLQLAIQLYGLRGATWPHHLLLWNPGLRRIGALFLPILLGLLMEIFVSRPITFALASQTGQGFPKRP